MEGRYKFSHTEKETKQLLNLSPNLLTQQKEKNTWDWATKDF